MNLLNEVIKNSTNQKKGDAKMIKKCGDFFRRFFGSTKGQGMVEYGLIIGLIAVAVIALLTLMGGQLQRLFQDVVTALTGAGGGGGGG